MRIVISKSNTLSKIVKYYSVQEYVTCRVLPTYLNSYLPGNEHKLLKLPYNQFKNYLKKNHYTRPLSNINKIKKY